MTADPTGGVAAPTHLTTADLAERWHMSQQWVTILARTKQIPGAMRVGNRWRYPVAAIEAWEQRHTVRDPLSLTDLAAARRTRKSA